MDCKECAENMTAFLDRELSAADSGRMRSHMDICAACAEELRSLEEAADFIESHRSDLAPRPESWNLVRARIPAADSISPFRFLAPNSWRIAVAALAIIAASALGYLQYQQIQRRSLDTYISQYIQEREASRPQSELPYADNPFIEIKAIPADNPFRSEDR